LPFFAQPQHRQQQGEEGLRLQHQRSQSGRHADVDGAEQESELADRHGQPERQVKTQRQLGRTHEQQCRKRRQQEAQRPQQQRRHAGQADLDDGEVDAPDQDDQQDERDVGGTHGLSEHE
jgi:hypothetical protein